ncbi:hypothetical protein CH92_10485 [Stutzerimonas stutzeri]|uniref:histidine kinase n=1 Tax=Stutzerimonas stutzeri TaxID=316 RepID=W8R4S7_STUST|nr:ATP-binding sensor histidine kinase [Stutzerimonas stutzeri]AHL77644.1 hypothetical protein CH92_10485 [Stutzerimonas stutzeri]MCQ4327921.1 AAA family ATPase [Stutzerimonas stutzeri]
MNAPTQPSSAAPLAAPTRMPTRMPSFDDAWLARLQWQAIDGCCELTRWRAHDASVGRGWLMLRANQQASLWGLARLDREYAIGPRLQPSWAVIPLARLSMPDGPVLVLDDDDGVPLSALTSTTLSVDRFLQLAIAACVALAQAHRQGLVHRDIRPHNLILGNDNTVKLTGFAFAALSDESPDEGLPRSENSLPYLAPEQAGRSAQASSPLGDLYALGISLFELLAGQKPFSAQNPMQWLHQHRAVQAPSVSASRPGIPAAIDDLLLALLDKQPSRRPASADSVASELQRCLSEWQETGSVHRALPRSRDADAALVGRSVELTSLQAAQARLSRGQGGVVLLHGEAGIGKTSLVRQWRASLDSETIAFAGGKCEQSRHRLPYAALSTALGSLFAHLAGGTPEAVRHWGEQLRAAVGEHGDMLARVIPELEWLTGNLPPGSNCPPVSEARRHLHGMIQRVLAVLATDRRPLVLFLDDVQWIDGESQGFLSELSPHNFDHLLLILAYRDSGEPSGFDTTAPHSRWYTLAPRTLDIALQPLTPRDVNQLLQRTLALQPQEHQLLAGRLCRRGNGNPLYVTQFVAMLRDSARPCVAANQVPLLSDVAALMESRLEQLPSTTREALGALAILNNPTPLDSLATVCRVDVPQLLNRLRPAFKAGLINEHREGLSFSHDVVWESILARIPCVSETRMRVEFAHALLNRMSADSDAEAVFWVAAHVLRAADLPMDDTQKTAFRELLIRAARLALASAAAQTALEYLTEAERMVEPGSAEGRQVALLLAQCLILSADLAAADQQIARLLVSTDDPLERAEFYRLRCEIHSLRGDYRSAVGTVIEGLALFDAAVPHAPTAQQAEDAWQALQKALGGRPAALFTELLPITDAHSHAALELLAALMIPGSFVQPNLLLLASSRIALLTLHHGMSSAGVLGLAWLGVISADRFERYSEGLEYTSAAHAIANKPGYSGNRTAVLVALDQVSVWTKPLPFALECAEAAYRTSIDQGSPTFACYANNHIVSDLLVMGAPIERMLRHIDAGLALAGDLEFQDAQTILHTQARYIRRLAGDGAGSVPIPTDEELAQRVADSQMGPLRFWWSLFEGLIRLLEGDAEAAAVQLDKAWTLVWSAPAHIHLIDLALFTVLNRAALQTSTGQPQSFDQPMHMLRLWAALNPRYFGDRLALAEAELLRLQGRPLDALQRYDEAISKAEQCAAVHLQGLCHEFAARCNADLGLTTSARNHLHQARDAWRRWGAHTLAKQLEAEHSFLSQPVLGPITGRTLPGGAQLDMLSITRACQALSREIEPDTLVCTLLENAAVHAGATYAALLLQEGGVLRVEAVGQTRDNGVGIALRPNTLAAEAAPLSLALRVMGCGEPMVINGAEALRRFGEDRYLSDVENGSLLCLPLLQRNAVVGVLYLENRLASGAFDPTRVDVLQLLAAQAAISLSTARLYTDLLAENQRRRESEGTLRRTQALLAIGQEVSRYGTFVWKYQSDRSFWTQRLLNELGLAVPKDDNYRHDPAVLVHAEDRPLFLHALEAATIRLDAFRLEFRTVSLDGLPRHLELAAEPDGTDAFIGVILDTTERRQTETALRAARAEMDRTSQATMLGELAASIAHEINQPLASILSNAGASIRWLERPQPELGEALEGLHDIHTEGQRAADIVRAMRALARQAPTLRKPIALDRVIRQVLAVTRPDLDDRRISVMLQIGSGSSRSLVEGDTVQLQQVIRNLITNAAEAMQALPPRTRCLGIQMQVAAEEMLVMVEDSGPGVPLDKQGRIFETFFSTKATGMGMGLSICSSIIAAHGGRLGFTQGRNDRSLFYFTLPLYRPA